MLYQITSFLLDIVVGLFAGACLLRLYMQLQRVPFGNPVGRFVFAVTDWLVLPLRRVLPAVGRWDLASLAGAWLAELCQLGLLWLLFGGLGHYFAGQWEAIGQMTGDAVGLLIGVVLVVLGLSAFVIRSRKH